MVSIQLAEIETVRERGRKQKSGRRLEHVLAVVRKTDIRRPDSVIEKTAAARTDSIVSRGRVSHNGIPAGEGDPVVHRHAVCVKGLADDEPVCPVLGEHFPETFVDDVDERSRYWRDPSRERGNAFHSAHVRFRAAVDGLSASATKGLARIERRHRDFPDEPPGIGPGQRHRLRAPVTPENGIVARRRKQEQGESFRKAAFAVQPASFFWRTKANIWP